MIAKHDSRIEFLSARAPMVIDRGGKWRDDQKEDMPWLKVRIDGKEGWVRAEEDLNALAFFQAG